MVALICVALGVLLEGPLRAARLATSGELALESPALASVAVYLLLQEAPYARKQSLYNTIMLVNRFLKQARIRISILRVIVLSYRKRFAKTYVRKQNHNESVPSYENTYNVILICKITGFEFCI